ncbi:MAG: winged helix-turn-helix domain-containing protein, partial [Acidobacteriota bacterium]
MTDVNEQPENPSRRARFGGFEVDLKSGELTRQGRRIRIPEKSFQVLTGLLERPGELVTRDELRERLWPPDTFVDFDNNMNAAVSRLREALNDSAQGPRFIETIPRRGYRYVGPPPQWDGDSEADGQRGSSGWRLQASLIAATFLILLLAVVLVLTRRSPREGAGEQASDRRML